MDMDNPTTLIVSIMYITIISIGLGNLLTCISDIVSGRKQAVSPSNTHLSWLLLLVISYFSFFWETTNILEQEKWNLPGFIAFLSGPILMLFATNLLCTLPETIEQRGDHYLDVKNRFFVFLIGTQVWILGLDIFFNSIGLVTYLNAGLIALLTGLILSNNIRLHQAIAAVCWLGIIGRIVIEAL